MLKRGMAHEISPHAYINAVRCLVNLDHLKVDNAWQEMRLADVYAIRNGKAIQMRAFADRLCVGVVPGFQVAENGLRHRCRACTTVQTTVVGTMNRRKDERPANEISRPSPMTSGLATRTKPLARQTLRVLDSASHAST
jgi:hypothetical protein